MKKKQNQEEGIRHAISINKSKRSKLGDITNQGLDLNKKKKQQSQSKSTKQIQKINFCTLDTSKQNKSKNSSMVIQPRYGSSADNTKCIQPIRETFESQMRGTGLFDSILKEKLSTIQQQNTYLSQMNAQLKSQLSKSYQQIILLNKTQGVLRQQYQKLNRKSDEEMDKYKVKQLELNSKIKQFKRQIEINQQNFKDQTRKLKDQIQSISEQKSIIQTQLNILKQQCFNFKNKIKNDEVDKLKQKQDFHQQIQEEKRKYLDIQNLLQKGLNSVSEKLIRLILTQSQKDLQNHIRNFDNSSNNFNSVLNLISQVQQEISKLSKQNKMLLLNFQQLNQSQQNYNEKLAVFLKQISIFRSQNQRLKKSLLYSEQSKQTIQVQADIYKTSALQKKLNETKNSLQHWKIKFHQSKSQSMRYQKQIQTLELQRKALLNNLKNLQTEIKNGKLQIYKSNQNDSVQKNQIKDLKAQIQKLQYQKVQIIKEGEIIAQKLNSFKEKVAILEYKLKQNKNNRLNYVHVIQNQNHSLLMQQFNTVTSDNFNMNSSQYSTNKSQYNKQIERQNSKRLKQYRGDMQQRLQQQFRSTRTLSVSPDKAKGISLTKQSII